MLDGSTVAAKHARMSHEQANATRGSHPMKLAALLIGCAMVACQQPTAPKPAKYQMVASGLKGAWKLDTETGTTWYCTEPMERTSAAPIQEPYCEWAKTPDAFGNPY